MNQVWDPIAVGNAVAVFKMTPKTVKLEWIVLRLGVATLSLELVSVPSRVLENASNSNIVILYIVLIKFSSSSGIGNTHFYLFISRSS